MTRVVAIDWSGRARGEADRLWLAEAGPSGLVRLEGGYRTRDELVAHLLGLAGERAVVGLDFAFSFPAWYARERGWRSAREVWSAMAGEAEILLTEEREPFWGRTQGQCVPEDRRLRETERETGEAVGFRPKSVFQIGGAGAVGTGSLRGVACLALLAEQFSVWPFDPPSTARLVEIYPRVLTGKVIKSSRAGRAAYLEQRNLIANDDVLRERATGSEDAFDAAVSALAMARHFEEPEGLEQSADERERLEGRIWRPAAISPGEAPQG